MLHAYKYVNSLGAYLVSAKPVVPHLDLLLLYQSSGLSVCSTYRYSLIHGHTLELLNPKFRIYSRRSLDIPYTQSWLWTGELLDDSINF